MLFGLTCCQKKEKKEEEKAGVTDMFFFADCISSLKTGQGRDDSAAARRARVGFCIASAQEFEDFRAGISAQELQLYLS